MSTGLCSSPELYVPPGAKFVFPPTVLPTRGIQMCGCSCQCERDFSTTVKTEVLSLISFYGRRRGPAFSNSVEHPSVQEMIECATVCYWNLKVEQLQMESSRKELQQVLVPGNDDTRILPPCFHRTLKGIKAIASRMRLVEDNEIKRILNEVDRRKEEEEEEKMKALEESMK
jgi:hypothetical protein